MDPPTVDDTKLHGSYVARTLEPLCSRPRSDWWCLPSTYRRNWTFQSERHWSEIEDIVSPGPMRQADGLWPGSGQAVVTNLNKSGKDTQWWLCLTTETRSLLAMSASTGDNSASCTGIKAF